jgi:ESS family glutamate:Na+ symporter
MSWKDIYVGLTPVWLMNGIALTFGVGFVMMIGFAVTGFVFFNRRKRR